MILSEAMAFVFAVPLVAAGMLVGWLLRARFPGRSCGRSESDPIGPSQADSISGAADKVPQAVDFASRIGDFADTIQPASPASAQLATAGDPIGNETAAPCVRNTFSLALGHRLAESARRGDPLSVILVRIDNYQNLGDRYGLQVGNQILDAAGKFFIASVRAMDWVARFDMTTFAFLLPNTAHANALRVAERLRTTISFAGKSIDGSPIPLTLSLGTTEAQLGDGSEATLRRAEEAMNASIRTGGNCIHSQAGGRLETAGAGYLTT
jgi:diguanylate cyclase (GGDEF)-like protein